MGIIKENLKILLAITILGISLLVVDYRATQKEFDGKIARNEAGKGVHRESLILKILDQNQEYEVEIADKCLKDDEIEQALNAAVQEIEENYLGDNPSANDVSNDLNLNESYVNGLIDVEWLFDKYGYIDSKGKIQDDKLTTDGQIITITADMKYEEHERLYSFCVVLVPKSLDTIEGQISEINRVIKESDSKTRSKSEFILPTSISGMDISWKRKMDYRGLQLIILGFICVIGISVGKKRDARKDKEKLSEEMNIDYPMIVNELSILMGAGMSFRKALERIVLKYTNNIKAGKIRKKLGFEQMVYVYRRMSDGLSEIQAIEELGMKCDSKEYRKLSMLLSQNLRKGSKDLIVSLEKEQQYAFEARKQRAIRAGEEASTKLLLPMAGMLFVVIIILVVPAMMQINI